MASQIITCPKCVKKFKGRDDLQGKKIKCPFCAHPFVVPKTADPTQAAVQAVEAARAAAAAKAGAAAKTAPGGQSAAPQPAAPEVFKLAEDKQRVTWDEEDDDQNPYGVTHLDLTPRCPHCAKELVSADAVICVYCGYNTLTRRHGETKKVFEMSGHDHFMHLLPGLLAASGIFFLIIFCGVFCLVWPEWVLSGSLDFTDHESARMWVVVICGFVIFGLGAYGYKRLILEPKPREREK